MRESIDKSRSTSKSTRSQFHLVNPSTVKWHIQSNDPDDMGDEEVEIPSIAAELTYNYSNYKPDKQSAEYVKIYAYPSRLSIIVDSIRHRTQFNRPPGVHPTLCCALSLGLPALFARRPIKKLSQLNDSFKKTRKEGKIAEVYIHDFLRSKVNCIIESGEEVNPQITSDIKQQLLQISSDTGMTQSTTALLAIYAAVIQQEETPSDYRNAWQESFDDSMNILECKADAAKAMIHRLEQRYK